MNLERLLKTTNQIISLKGSASSGNYGHVGRPGKLGGSSPGGGHARIGVNPKDPPQKIKRAAKKYRKSEKRFKHGKKLFEKVKHGGQLKLTDGNIDVDVSIKTGSGVLGMAVKWPWQKKFGKHLIKSSNDIKNYLSQFQERKAHYDKKVY